MRFDRLYTKLFCQPVLIESGYRVGLELALISLMQGQKAEPALAELRKIDPDRQAQRSDGLLEIRGDTAIVHLDGVIDKNLSMWERLCLGATDLNDVDNALARVASDSSIKNVLLALDSPGGSFPGVPETAGRVAALAASGKDTIAFCGDMACSAAYWIAAQCDQVFATSSASVGSIGVYLAILDQSRQFAEMGINVQEIKDGSLKTAGAPWKPLGDNERLHLQERVEHIGAMFRSAVTAVRPGVTDSAMQGQSFIGNAPGADFKSALDAGLIDGIMPTLEDAIAAF